MIRTGSLAWSAPDGAHSRGRALTTDVIAPRLDRSKLRRAAIIFVVGSVAIMAVTRHQVRVLYLEPATSQFQAAIVPQWGNFFLFAALLVIGLATVFWMVRRVLTSPAEGDQAA